MTMHLTKAPHQGAREPVAVAPNAALLIDFDNVTMGMRSDLSKELKTLLNSDIIKGKVTVQRAYADWRRYPQYIVPLSEASIDLIFAPAYGSNKKNATDIRMAIDGMELVFIRPEIGTFILLTGDSDFSSLVLKLKEYGKYVIGVGIQESSSDILVQNCDEYYSYTSLSGLRKTTDSDRQPLDPWVLVERAVEQMTERGDVMRSDRLKQVMVELDPGFDEGEYGFSKFSRFLTEASSKGLVQIKKLDNGQYEVAPSGRSGGRRGGESRAEEPKRHEERGRGRSEERRSGREASSEGRSRGRERADGDTQAVVPDGPPLQAAYDLMRRALERLLADGRDAVRDSDVKRKMLELEPGFDESNLGFSKFSRFLRQAHDQDVVELRRRDSGNYEVSLRPEGKAAGNASSPSGSRTHERQPARQPQEAKTASSPAPEEGREEPEPRESALAALGRRLGLRLGSPRRSTPEVPAAEPQASETVPEEQRPAARQSRTGEPSAAAPSAPVAAESSPARSGNPEEVSIDPSRLGLPTDTDAQVRYLANSYSGVGKKTAEKLVEGFGEELFTVLQREPERVQEVIPAARAENVLEQWKVDLDRRRTRLEGEADGESRQGGGGRERAERPARRHHRRGEGDGRGRSGPVGDQPTRTRDDEPVGVAATDEARQSDSRVAPAPRREEPSAPPPQATPPAVERREAAPEAPETASAEPSETASVEPPKTASVEPETAATPASGIPDLDDLEPSRLHTRTSRKGRRR